MYSPTPLQAQPTGWRIDRWAEETTLSRGFVRLLVKAKKIRSVKAGKARVILTAPAEYLESLADNEAA